MTIYQCQKCGKMIFSDKMPLVDGIYSYIYCPDCKKVVPCLECGNDVLTVSSEYNVNIDPRYYNTK